MKPPQPLAALPGRSLSRRTAIGQGAALLAAGLWPGATSAQSAAQLVEGKAGQDASAGEVTFAVANDFHHDNSPECDVWFDRLFRQIGAHPGLACCFALGDLANKGLPASLAAMKGHLAKTGVPTYVVPGNHDNDVEQTTRLYSEVFPNQLNQTITHAGWQFVAIDTTDGKKWGDTRVSAATLAWLDAELPTLDAARPTVLLTHFPLAAETKHCPLNATEVLRRFDRFNLRGVFTGHFHGQTHVLRGGVPLETNVCCARVTGNHDGSVHKGYYLCRGAPDGTLAHRFVPFLPAAT